jgi:penicillin-binding protein 2
MTERRSIIQIIIVAVAMVFIVRLFFIQVLDNRYKLEAQHNVMRKVVEYPYRGLIYDRKGKIIVYNVPVFDLLVITREMKIKDTAKFCEDFNMTKQQFITTMKKLKQDKGYSSKKPVPFLKQLSIKDFAKLQDVLMDYKGFYPQARTIRGYPRHSMANALGYIGEISKKQLDKQKVKYYEQGDYVGISGLEGSYEEQLRGRRGSRYVMKNVHGVEKGSYKEGSHDTTSIPGQNLTSTVDIELQEYGEKLMSNKIGSVVAIVPSTGEILAFVSAPTYDPNELTGREFSTNFHKLDSDPLKPLFNRPLMAMYPPGSIFKIAQALVGQQIGVLKPSTIYPCNQSWGPKCHDHPSPNNLAGSIQWSCNPYYYMVFKNIIQQDKNPNKFIDSEMGYNQWRELIMSFGFGKRMEVDLPNMKAGYIPTTQFYDKWYGNHRWKHSTIRSLDIGQGELLIVPIQMANMAAIIANRGYYYTPHLVKQIGNNNKLPAKFTIRHQTGVDPKYFPVIVDGMEQVVIGGTAAWTKIQGITICGKTGTVQNPHGNDHSVFMAFAPKENPKIAICAFIENAGFGAMTAAPIVNLMIDKYLRDTVSRPPMEKYILEKNLIGKKRDSVK